MMSESERNDEETEGSASYYVRSSTTVKSSSSEFVRYRASTNALDPSTIVTASDASDSAAPLRTLSAGVKLPTDVAAPSTSAAASTATAKLVTLPPNARIETGFAHYGPRMRLYCRTGFCITVLADGSVIGDPLANHSSGVLEFTSAGVGEVRIRGVEANLYLAMNRRGKLYGEEDPRDYATVFVERTYGQYNTYLSQKYAHRGWYVAIKKSGAIKKASQTKWGQKAIQFLPIRA